MPEQPIKLIQITDCHLGEEHGRELLAMDPDESLADVLSLLNQQRPSNDLMIVTGDLANDPVLSAYQRLHDILSSSIDYPFSWMPGNHDDSKVMAHLGEAVNVKIHDLGPWLIVMLDSHLEGCIYGYLQPEELQFLEETLSRYPDKHTMVCMHHQPVPIGSEWMDRYIVQNAQDFWQVIDRFAQVKAVVWGHVHQQFDEQYGDIALLATPSTCIQFTPGKKEFEVEDIMPGYRWFELHADGTFKTAVERIDAKDYGIDFNSHGY